MTSSFARRAVIIFIILAILFIGFRYLTRQDPVAVILHTVGRGTVEATVSNTRVGTVKACHRSMLAPTVGGEVSRLTVREGDKVQAGQVLLEIWNDDLEAQLELARAQVATSIARAVEACKLSAGSGRELRRVRKLLENKLISEEKVALQLTDFEARQAGCNAAEANTRVSEAQIKVAQSTLERTIVHAPFDGIVAEVNAELGEYVTPSPQGIQTLPAIDLLDMGCLYVSAPIDEVDAPPIKVGMSACVSLDAFPEQRCNAVVRRIAPYVLEREKQARTVEVEVELPDPADKTGLLPGYSADIEIQLGVKTNVLRIPTEAVLEDNHVLLFDEITGILRLQAFEPGLANWNFTEIRSGLKVGDRIVLSIGRDGVETGALAVPEP